MDVSCIVLTLHVRNVDVTQNVAMDKMCRSGADDRRTAR